jgi:hypothetical protein
VPGPAIVKEFADGKWYRLDTISTTAIEPVIGHLKDDHRMRRNHLKGRHGDRINAVLAAAGYNFSPLLRWFEQLLGILSLILWRLLSAPSVALKIGVENFLHGDHLSPSFSKKASAAGILCCRVYCIFGLF